MADWAKVLFQLSDTKILLYLHERGIARYYELQDNVVDSRSTLAKSLRSLKSKDLVARKIKDTRPIQTQYVLTSRGKKLVAELLEIRKILEI